MSNYSEVKKDVVVYLKARTPFIVIESSERERVERMLSEIATEEKITIDYYTDSKQLLSYGARRPPMDISNDPLKYGFEKFSKSKNGFFAIGDITKIDSDNAYSREFLNLLYMARESRSTVIVITADPIWARLSVLGVKIDLAFPDQSEIVNIIESFIATYSTTYTVEWTEKDIATASALIKGLSELQIENALSAELIARNGLFSKNVNKIVSRKDRFYGSVGAIQPIKLPESITVSGMENLKNWLDSTKEVFFARENVLEYYQIKPPKGILLFGVPGCGKSFCAKMIAKEWGLPLYRFDVGTLFDKWMGESERKMRESLQFIDNVSPCVLWIDEIEKMLSTSDTSNDTGNRILGQFLFWLQESSSRVFLVATANNIQKLPPELFRKGRFSEIFFTDLPNERERAQVIKLYLQKSLHIELSEKDINYIVNVTKGYSYADIEIAIKNVSRMLVRDSGLSVNAQMIVQQVNSIVPFSKSNPELVKQCQEWGREKAINVSIVNEEVCV